MSDTANAAVEIAEEALEQKFEDALEQKFDELAIDGVTSPSNSEEKLRKKRLPTAERIRLWEEEQKGKTILSTGLKGTVKWYSVLRRYGFISREDGEKDVFAHQTAIAKSATEKFYLRTLADEENVVFDLVEGKNGPEAANITGPDGENVMGSRYRHKLLSRFRKNRKPNTSVDGEETAPVTDLKDQESAPKAEETKKPRKQRRNRKPKTEKGSGDAAVNEGTDSSDASTNASPNVKSIVAKITEEPALTKLDRCDSALGDAGLGAQAIDAQI